MPSSTETKSVQKEPVRKQITKTKEASSKIFKYSDMFCNKKRRYNVWVKSLPLNLKETLLKVLR